MAAYLQHTQRSTSKLREAAATIRSQNASLEQANRLLRERSTAAMESLSATVDARDAYTAGHSRRVQYLALAIGRELGLSQAELDLLGHAALFHDIGKLAVPDAVLLKPATLTNPEWELMQRHAYEGARIIDRLGFLNDAVPAIRHHHERFDGSGYPDGLAGEEIPLGARIIHVADALDSMLTTRIYSPARPAHAALDELREGADSQFCPRCVGALDRLVDGGALDVAILHSPVLANASSEGLAKTVFVVCRTLTRPITAQGRRERSSRGVWTRLRATGGRRLGASGAARRHNGCFARVSCGLRRACSLPTVLYPAGRRAMARDRKPEAGDIDPEALADFRLKLRRRYSDEELLEELRGCANRLGRSPTMRDLVGDAHARVHPQTRGRALRLVERGQAPGRAAGAPVRDARGAGRAASRPRRRARAAAHRPRSRVPAWPRPFEVARLAYVRIVLRRRFARRASTSRRATSGRRGRLTRASSVARELGRLPALHRLGRGAPRRSARF